LRELGLRGTDIIEQLLLTKVGAEEVSKSTTSHIKEMLDAGSGQRRGTEELPQLEIELARLREIDHRCLDVEDLLSERGNKWVVNDTELLLFCDTFYSSGKSNWLRSVWPDLMKEIDDIRGTVESQAKAQIEICRNSIEKWAKTYVDPTSLENVQMVAFKEQQEQYDAEEQPSTSILEERATKNSEMKVRSQDQMAKLKEMQNGYDQFLATVQSRFGWSKPIKGYSNEQRGKLFTFVGRLDKALTTYWTDLEKRVLEIQLKQRKKEEISVLLRSKSADHCARENVIKRDMDRLTKECDAYRQREEQISKEKESMRKQSAAQEGEIEELQTQNREVKAKLTMLEKQLKESIGFAKSQSQSSLQSPQTAQSQSSLQRGGSKVSASDAA